ncbi:MAG: hypothetical protein HC910_22145 [Spirulinaceae cyanobacterium SM2_1_0]|nr:hypothetical protein [Spirulinaceae cyanobacterium SM2_1_0]
MQTKLGDAFQQDAGIPTAAELGFDLTLSIFESGVSQRLDELRAALASQSPGLSDLLSTHASIFQGLAESLALPGFKAIADAVIAATAHQPQQAITIATLALADWQAGHQAVLAGDRDQGGAPSPDLLALAGEAEALTDTFTDTFWDASDWHDNSPPAADFWATAEASADNTEALPDGFWASDDTASDDVSLADAPRPDDFWGTPLPDDFWGTAEPVAAAPPDPFWDHVTAVEAAPESDLNDRSLSDSDFWGEAADGNTFGDDFWTASVGAEQTATPAALSDFDWLTDADMAAVDPSAVSSTLSDGPDSHTKDGAALTEPEFDLASAPETNLWDSLGDFDLDSATRLRSDAAAEPGIPDGLANLTHPKHHRQPRSPPIYPQTLKIHFGLKWIAW